MRDLRQNKIRSEKQKPNKQKKEKSRPVKQRKIGFGWLHVHGLKQRWIMSMLLVALAAAVVVVSAYSWSILSSSYSAMREGLYIKAKTASDFFANYVTQTYAEYYDSAYMYVENFEDADKLELQFINISGQVELSSHRMTVEAAPGTPDITGALNDGVITSWEGKNSTTGERIMAVSAPILYANGQIIGVMRYVTSLKLVDARIYRNILIVSAAGLAVLAILVIVSMLFLQSVVEPIRDITSAAKQMASGSYGIQIGRKYSDEIGDMVDVINEMSIKISQSERAQSEFVSSVSHELRTPLTAITGWGETILYNENLDDETRKGVEIIQKEARRLTKMVEELLEFTRMQDGRFTLNAEMIDVAAELEDSIFTYRELLKQDDMTIVYEPSDEELPLINGDPERLRQVFYNIFDNAVKYARDGRRIDVGSNTDGDNVFITIRDYGPGIPEDELERVKLKFYKGSSKERGSGIGLAVCDEIIKYHGGDLTLSNAAGGGTLVTIRIPLEPKF